MSGTSAKGKSTPETVTVVVVVNHDDLRRGERGEVELTKNVRARLEKGYLRLADDADAPADGGPVAPLGSRSVSRNGQSTTTGLGGEADVAGGPDTTPAG